MVPTGQTISVLYNLLSDVIRHASEVIVLCLPGSSLVPSAGVNLHAIKLFDAEQCRGKWVLGE